MHDVFGGPTIPWWVYNVVLIGVVSVLGYFRISLSARILTIAMCLEVVIIVVYDAVVFAQGGSEGITAAPLAPHNILSGSIGLAALFGIGMFSGFEATAVFREEARDPARTIPRATYIVISVVAVLYAVTAFALIVGIGPSTAVATTAADPVGSVLASVEQYLGTVGKDIAMVLLCTSIFAAVLAMHNIVARYLFSMGKDRVFPQKLGSAHHRHGSPHISSIVTTVVAVLFLVVLLVVHADSTSVYAKLAGIALYALIMLLILTSAAVLAYFRGDRGRGLSTWQTLIAPGLAGIGFCVALVLATQNSAFLVGGSQPAATALIITFFVIFVVGVAYALLLRRTRPDTYVRIGRQDV